MGLTGNQSSRAGRGPPVTAPARPLEAGAEKGVGWVQPGLGLARLDSKRAFKGLLAKKAGADGREPVRVDMAQDWYVADKHRSRPRWPSGQTQGQELHRRARA